MDALHPWAERLSEYLDGDLGDAERAGLEMHLRGCADCRAILEELRAVVVRARALEDRPPAIDLWPGIAARIAADRRAAPAGRRAERRRAWSARFTFTPPQLAAAAIALFLLSSGAVWLALSAGAPGPAAPVAQAPPRGAGDAALRLASDRSTPDYDAAVAELERVLEEGRGRLAPETIQVLEANLRSIDRAIAEARRALAQDPMNVYLNRHLAESMQQKLRFLRRAGEIVRART
ncbi:MAG TPA: zf-HC2 domain-containing protein [Longimicrobiales bacterium]